MFVKNSRRQGIKVKTTRFIDILIDRLIFFMQHIIIKKDKSNAILCNYVE